LGEKRDLDGDHGLAGELAGLFTKGSEIILKLKGLTASPQFSLIYRIIFAREKTCTGFMSTRDLAYGARSRSTVN
jgi:hypothetical protein